MDGKQYKLRILPLFEEDFNEILDYITLRLKNIKAADDLIADVETAIQKRLSMPEAFEPYPSTRDREHPSGHDPQRGLYSSQCLQLSVR